jgi:hypothetical protein
VTDGAGAPPPDKWLADAAYDSNGPRVFLATGAEPWASVHFGDSLGHGGRASLVLCRPPRIPTICPPELKALAIE